MANERSSVINIGGEDYELMTLISILQFFPLLMAI